MATATHRTHTVFVYGTLMRGFGNHGLLAGATYLGPAGTAAAWRLLDLGAFPALVSAPDGFAAPVRGELYRVDGATLAALDRLEGHPDFYRRVPILVYPSLRSVEPLGTVQGYVLTPAAAERYRDRRIVPGGDWRAWAGRGPAQEVR